MYGRFRSLLRECDAVIVVIFALGVGIVVSCGFMWFTKDRAYTEPSPPRAAVSDMMLLAQLQSDVGRVKNAAESLHEWNRFAARVITEQSAEIAGLRDALARLRREVEALPRQHTVDLPGAAFGPEPELIPPPKVPVPVRE